MGKSFRENRSRKFNSYYDDEYTMKGDMRQDRSKGHKMAYREALKAQRLGDKQFPKDNELSYQSY